MGKRYIVTRFWLVEQEIEVVARNGREAVEAAEDSSPPYTPVDAGNARFGFAVRSRPKSVARWQKEPS
jgi:hypothetical protein